MVRGDIHFCHIDNVGSLMLELLLGDDDDDDDDGGGGVDICCCCWVNFDFSDVILVVLL